MKLTSLLSPAAAVALLTAAVLAATTGVQATQDQPQTTAPAAQTGPSGSAPPQGAPGGRPPRSYPAPTNLQVLPKDLTGQQVHEIMEGFAGSLGVIMLTMTQQINADYISKASVLDPDSMKMKVTCGTCHRGHEMPEEFVIPKEGGPGGPPPAGGAPTGTPPPAAGTPPPAN